jgi:hypothetical protein
MSGRSAAAGEFTMMIPRTTLMSFAALSLAGSVGGVYLGRAAVSEINPIYYSTPEPRFHADLVPYRASAAAGYRAGDLSQANLDQALGRTCVNCLTYPEEVILVHRGQADKYVPGGAEVAAAPAVAAVVEHQPSPEFASVERYTAFPVAAEPEPAELAGSDAAEAEVSLAAAD